MDKFALEILLPSVLTVCLGAITTLLFPYIRKKLKLSDVEGQIAEKALQAAEAKLTKENVEKITDYIEQLVKSAEEKGRSGEIETGSQKFTYVLDLAKRLAAQFNIDISEDYIKALIDAKVTELIAQGIKKIASET